MVYNLIKHVLFSFNKKNALDFLWTLVRTVLLEAPLPADVRENETALKRKSTQTCIQAIEYTFW